MGNHRLAARMMNHINRLFYCTPLRRHVTGFPAGKVFLKTSAMFFAWPASTRKRAKWPRVTAPPSASRSAPSQAPGIRAFSSARQSSDRAAGAALSAPPAGRSSLGAQYQYSDPQYESRDSPRGWKSRRRSPWSRVIRRGRSPPGRRDRRHAVMVGDRRCRRASHGRDGPVPAESAARQRRWYGCADRKSLRIGCRSKGLLLDINVNKRIIIPTGRENLQTRVDFIPLN